MRVAFKDWSKGQSFISEKDIRIAVSLITANHVNLLLCKLMRMSDEQREALLADVRVRKVISEETLHLCQTL